MGMKDKCKIYYLDGSTRIINYKGDEDPWIESYRGSYSVITCSDDIGNIRGVDRVDIIKKQLIKR